MGINLHEHLNDVLETHRMTHIDDLVQRYKSKREDIKEALTGKYLSDIYNTFNSGSFAKHTGINSKFDLDIVVPFKKNAFSTLELMFDDVFNFLEDRYKDVATVRKQKVSIGVIFHEDDIDIDVVPGRELSLEDYKETSNLNLFFNEGMGLYVKNSYLKTNIQAQIDHIKAKEDERKIIRLLKIWKNSNNENFKSFLLELITIRAFEKVEVVGSFWEKLKNVMEFIKDNITKEGFSLKDPGNSNNDVVGTLESWEKIHLSSRMELIIQRIEDNSENIKTYFPVNEQFESKKLSGSSYGIKGVTIAPSIPSNNQRFG